MEVTEFLQKRYNVPSDKSLSDVLELPRFTWSDVCELLVDYGKTITPYSSDVAKKLIAIREAILRSEMDEAFHQLYMIANPDIDKYSGEIWAEMEAIASEI